MAETVAHTHGSPVEMLVQAQPGTVTFTTGVNTQTFTVGTDDGEAAALVMWETAGWPWWWLGWGPARICELRTLDAQGHILATLPAGCGWIGEAAVAQRVLFGYHRKETAPRLTPLWYRNEVENVAHNAGLPLAYGTTRHPFWLITSLSDPESLPPPSTEAVKTSAGKYTAETVRKTNGTVELVTVCLLVMFTLTVASFLLHNS